ncbi:MAG: transposase [Nocardia sp.]|nr:transposase [Nocardia sp.]
MIAETKRQFTGLVVIECGPAGPDSNATRKKTTPARGAGFRKYGKPKDHRDDLPQIVIGLAVTRAGIPMRCWCWPGKTDDQTVLAEVKDDMRDWKLGRVITVVDRGFSSADNLAYLRRAGGDYIAGMRMRDGGDLVDQALARQGCYQDVRDNLRVKEVRIDGAGDARFIICHNPEQAERDRHQRETAIARVEAELEWIKAQRQRDHQRRAKMSTKARERPRPRTSGPSARCVTTPPSSGGSAGSPVVASRSTERRSRQRRTWTAST